MKYFKCLRCKKLYCSPPGRDLPSMFCGVFRAWKDGRAAVCGGRLNAISEDTANELAERLR